MGCSRLKICGKYHEHYSSVGMAGHHVALNEKGEVVARILDTPELLRLKELYDDFKDIPDDYKIYTEKDI